MSQKLHFTSPPKKRKLLSPRILEMASAAPTRVFSIGQRKNPGHEVVGVSAKFEEVSINICMLECQLFKQKLFVRFYIALRKHGSCCLMCVFRSLDNEIRQVIRGQTNVGLEGRQVYGFYITFILEIFFFLVLFL